MTIRLLDLTADELRALPVGSQFVLQLERPEILTKVEPDGWSFVGDGEVLTSDKIRAEVDDFATDLFRGWTLLPAPSAPSDSTKDQP